MSYATSTTIASRKNASSRTFELCDIDSITPSPENDRLYRPINPDDPDFQKLVESIEELGIREPIVVTDDRYILSGHRRYAAARAAGLDEVPIRYEHIRRTDDIDRFIVLLREANRQRNKTFDEKLREELVSVNPDEAYQSLIEERNAQLKASPRAVAIEGRKTRAKIGRLKQPMLDAVLRVIEGRRKFWPLSVRGIHYPLLNDPPPLNANRPEDVYTNTPACYDNLSKLVTRARLQGLVPWEAITDETRPFCNWSCWRDPQAFIGDQLNGMFKGYWRDLMQSQPNYIEVIVEKNTVFSIVKDVTQQFCIPTMSGRGFCSIDAYHDVFVRYRKSGKNKLVLIVASDFDPEGEEIVQVAARTMRDDFGVRKLDVIKAAITPEQIRQFKLPSTVEAKASSSRYDKFVERHGTSVHELEAMTPEQLQGVVTQAIDGVLDREAFNHELEAEKNDATQLSGVRRTIVQTLREAGITDQN